MGLCEDCQKRFSDEEWEQIEAKAEEKMELAVDSPAFQALLNLILDTLNYTDSSGESLFEAGVQACHERVYDACLDEAVREFEDAKKPASTEALPASN